MRKTINICGKEYEVGTNALTLFLYKKEFKTGLMADIARMNMKQPDINTEGKTQEEIDEEVGIALMPDFDNYIEVALRIAYILIKTVNSNFMPFENWLETITEIDVNAKWISEVTELAVNSFCR